MPDEFGVRPRQGAVADKADIQLPVEIGREPGERRRPFNEPV